MASSVNGHMHSTFEIHTKETLLIDLASRVSVVRTWKTSPRAECFGDTHQKKEQKQCINMVVQLLRASRDGPLKLLV